MLTGPYPIPMGFSRTSAASSVVGEGVGGHGTVHRRFSPTPSEQSYRTIGTHPVSLFSVSQLDARSDTFSLATMATGDLIGGTSSVHGGGGGGHMWDRTVQSPSMSYAYSHAQPPNFLNMSQNTSTMQRNSASGQKDLFEFLKEAELEHYYAAFTTHLKIRSIEHIKYVEDSDLAELGLSRPEQRRLRKYFKRECPQTTMGKLRKRLSRSAGGFRSASVSRARAASELNDRLLPDSPMRRLSSTERNFDFPERRGGAERLSKGSGGPMEGTKPMYRLIPTEELELGTSLGEGQFGRVCQGVWHPSSGGIVQVAIKSISSLRLTDESLTEFLTELSEIQELQHPDILRLYGISLESDAVRIVMELAPLRSLLECIREPELRASLPVSVLHQFAVQIARGMAFLEEAGLVHRDLAARNVLVFSKTTVKIGDMGMSRALQLGKSYYQSNLNVSLKLPIAWCAPEAALDAQFTTASDVWAYGVTLWELFTYGFTPWAGLTGRQVLDAIDAPRSARLDQPDACPDAIYDAVMRACWAHAAPARPSFAQILSLLPRLCPERWITTCDYQPDTTGSVSNGNTSGIETHHLVNGNNNEDSQSLVAVCPSTSNGNGPESETESAFHPLHRGLPHRTIGRFLSVRSNEVVYILGKRSVHSWKVVTQRFGQVGCLPTSILRLYSDDALAGNTGGSLKPGSSALAGSRDTLAKDGPVSTTNGGGSVAATKSLLRTSRRETVSRLTKLSSSTSDERRQRRLTADKISLPQNDFRHLGHLGTDGHVYGNLGFNTAQSADNSHHLPMRSIDTITMTNHGEANSKVVGTGSSSMWASVDKPLETDIDTMGLDFGSSLLDEVFKCFSLTTDHHQEQQEPERTVNQTETIVARGDILVDEKSPTHTLPVQDNPATNLYQRACITEVPPPTVCVVKRVQPSTIEATQCSPIAAKTYTSAVTICASPSTPELCTPTVNKATPTMTERRSRALFRPATAAQSAASNSEEVAPPSTPGSRSRWKRSTFGSLTRRSASVSKVNGSGDRKASEAPVSDRLTISRPVLLHKPTIAGSTTHLDLNDPLSDPPFMTNNPAAESLLDLVMIGRPTKINPTTSEESSSLTVVSSSSNGYAYSSIGDLTDEPSNDFPGRGTRASRDRAPISPAPSLSSLSANRTGAVGVSSSNSQWLTNGSMRAPSSTMTVGGLRALRAGAGIGGSVSAMSGGDVVFRATAGGTLNQRRRNLGASAVTSYATETRSSTARVFANGYGSHTLSRSPTDYHRSARVVTSAASNSGALRSRLDGLPAGSTPRGSADEGGIEYFRDTETEHVGDDYRSNTCRLSRRFSTSSVNSPVASGIGAVISNSSYHISPPLGSPQQSRGRPTSPPPESPLRDAPSHSGKLGLDNPIASFWGSTFADLLGENGHSATSNGENPMVMHSRIERHAE